ncbi:MAG: PHP domain-containing protein [Clostridia bacterium]|nr:PHP domain-containing protein [Clostridia bacterium]
MHERTFSGDSKMNLREIVTEAKRKGLDAVCITDHDAIGLAAYAARLAQEENFPIFVGVEYLALEGDIVAFGIDDLPAPHLSAQAFIDYVTAQGGVCIAAHPYRSNSRGLGDLLFTLQNLLGAEVYNGSTTPLENQMALQTCKKAGLKPFGASDAHTTVQVGLYATEIPGHFTTTAQLVEAIKTQACRPVCLSGFRAL